MRLTPDQVKARLMSVEPNHHAPREVADRLGGFIIDQHGVESFWFRAQDEAQLSARLGSRRETRAQKYGHSKKREVNTSNQATSTALSILVGGE
jgi:hypothetical protein